MLPKNGRGFIENAARHGYPWGDDLSMSKSFRCTLQVRGYELDSFGHVNHAVYVSYLEHARWEMLSGEGITLQSFRQWSRWPVIASLQIQYLRPCFMDDVLEVRSRISGHGKAQFTIEQEIYRADQPVVKAQVQAVIVNEKGRPAELPPDIARLWKNSEDAGGGI